MKKTSPPPVVNSTNSWDTNQLRSVTGAINRTVPSVKAPAARSPRRLSPPPSQHESMASAGASRMKLSRSSVVNPYTAPASPKSRSARRAGVASEPGIAAPVPAAAPAASCRALSRSSSRTSVRNGERKVFMTIPSKKMNGP